MAWCLWRPRMQHCRFAKNRLISFQLFRPLTSHLLLNSATETLVQTALWVLQSGLKWSQYNARLFFFMRVFSGSEDHYMANVSATSVEHPHAVILFCSHWASTQASPSYTIQTSAFFAIFLSYLKQKSFCATLMTLKVITTETEGKSQ